MSIYATIFSLDDNPPIAYAGSHILPSGDDQRGGDVHLAVIPSHITRDGRDDAPEDGRPWPYARLSIDDGQGRGSDAIIDPRQARALAAALIRWAASVDGPPAADVLLDQAAAQARFLGDRLADVLVDAARDAREIGPEPAAVALAELLTGQTATTRA